VFAVLAAYAFTCADLLLRKQKKQLFFPRKTQKRKERRKKGYAFLTAMQRRLSKFFKPLVIPLQACFVEQRERLTNTALPSLF
jgi:hypothetical protein